MKSLRYFLLFAAMSLATAHTWAQNMPETGNYQVMSDKTAQYLTLSCESLMGNELATIAIKDAQGALVRSAQIAMGDHTLDIQNLPAGIYSLHVSDGKRSYPVRYFTKLNK